MVIILVIRSVSIIVNGFLTLERQLYSELFVTFALVALYSNDEEAG